ncbi:S41 family peptidase [Clostridium perfringens]|uniref:S41 family peptidase n=1 Tax=Clostridium perfringens TaxID=1502 RepID=UPI002904DA0F|nr:hypothetical protein [Clostridium perfringens]MDK0981159.1 S41 family peptidase [Clostridium perfringens]MDU3020321.1 S41 family peptidase [Clostridium perfringens]
MYPNKIIYDDDLRIEILKKQGISSYKIKKDTFYVLYSVYNDITIGDLIHADISNINNDKSIIKWSKKNNTFNKKTIYAIQHQKNEYIYDNNCLFLKIVDFEKFPNISFKENYKTIVLDLRNNTGGSIKTMSIILSMFLEKNVVLELLDLNTFEIKNYIIHASKKIKFKNMLIIMDKTTYSSPEIFSKLISTQNNVDILGKSFGKDCIYEETFKDSKNIILEKKYLIL